MFHIIFVWICRYNWANKNWYKGLKIGCGETRARWFFYSWRKCATEETWYWIRGDWGTCKEAWGMSLDALHHSHYLMLWGWCLTFSKPTSSSRQHIAYMRIFWREWYIIRELSRVLRISCTFYYLVASTACFVQMMTIQVLAEREQKIQTEVKEIKKVFFCDLCNKQYKLAMEFESHLSSYDHNHRKVSQF